MKKSFICLILSLALLLSCLCGCDFIDLGDFLPNDGDAYEPTPRPTVAPPFESYEALITRDDLVLWKSADPTSEILGTVSSGDTLRVLQIITVDGISWASTDRGWIYAEHVQLPAQEQQTPINDGTNAMVIAGSSDIHVSPDPSSSTRGTLNSGDRVTISQFTHYAGTAMVYVGNGWVKLYDLMFDGCTRSGVIPCIVTYDGMNVRSGPSTNYASVGKASAGTKILVRGILNSDMKGKPWAVSNDNKWYFLEYLQLPEGIVHVAGDNADYPFPPKDGETTTQDTPSQNNMHSHISAKPTPNNSGIVGHWIRYDRDAFMNGTGGTDDFNYSFYSTGEVYTGPPAELTIYSPSEGHHITGKGGASDYGHFTFDGSTLKLTFYCVSYAAEHEIYSTPEVRSYSASLNGDFLTLGDETYYRIGNQPDYELIRIYMTGNTGPYVKPEYVGTWTMADGSTLTLKDDGTFTESEGGYTYTGDYLISNGGMYLSRTKRNGSAYKFYIVGRVSLSGDTLRYDIYGWDWETPDVSKIYTRSTE